MKKILVILLVALSAQAMNEKKALSESPKLDSDRVWTFTHYEYGLLREKQKEEFAQLLLEESKSNPVLNNLISHPTAVTVKNTIMSSSKWDLVEFKINKACKDKKNSVSCEKIAALRLSILEKYRAHK